MSFLSSSLSLTRYAIAEDVPRELLAEAPQRLVRHKFQDIDHTAEERSFGWVSVDDYLDPDFTSGPPEKGAYFAFALRLDTRRIQPAVFKKHVTMAEREYLASITDEDRKFLSKDRKREIKEQVALKLRARALPIPAVFHAAWDTSTNRVYLATTNAKVRSLFEDHFTVTFELTLTPLTPFYQAVQHVGEERVMQLENLEPSDFSPSGGRP